MHAAAVVKLVEKVEEEHRRTRKRQTMLCFFAVSPTSIAGLTGDATMGQMSVPGKHQVTTTRPRGKIVWEAPMLSVSR